MERLFEQLRKLVEEIEELKQLTHPFTQEQQERFELWRHKSRNVLSKVYGPKSEQATAFDKVHYSSDFWMSGMGAKEENEWYQRGLSSARALLRSLLESDGTQAAASDRVRDGIPDRTPMCFVSASFDSDAAPVVEWFCELARAVGFEVLWLKEFAEPRPPEEKVKSHLKSSECIIQVLTRDVEAKGKEKGWIGNEMAWSEELHGHGKQALFVEVGMKATGIGPEITEVVSFDRERLDRVAPRAVVYLKKLLENARHAA